MVEGTDWVERGLYRPFGDSVEWVDPAEEPESHNYIGERRDETGLMYLNARYYDPTLGHFLSPDWFPMTVPGVGPHRYHYSLFDPINLRDPSGNAPDYGYGTPDSFDDGFDNRVTFRDESFQTRAETRHETYVRATTFAATVSTSDRYEGSDRAAEIARFDSVARSASIQEIERGIQEQRCLGCPDVFVVLGNFATGVSFASGIGELGVAVRSGYAAWASARATAVPIARSLSAASTSGTLLLQSGRLTVAGTYRHVDDVFAANISLASRPSGYGSLFDISNQLLAQARASGASRLTIQGSLIGNPAILRNTQIWQRLGYTVDDIGGNFIRLSRNLD